MLKRFSVKFASFFNTRRCISSVHMDLHISSLFRKLKTLSSSIATRPRMCMGDFYEAKVSFRYCIYVPKVFTELLNLVLVDFPLLL